MRKAPTDPGKKNDRPKEVDEHTIELDDPENPDPWVMEDEPRTFAAKKMECFSTDLFDSTKELQVESESPTDFKDCSKKFLSRNLDIFAWKRGNMVGIDPNVSYHRLPIDVKHLGHR
ncbi:Uncharacterized protein Adt_35208 [Abeliophyllum distichum]|uniref:Uncharacterized protein n=1 Tax=Abeliophyllum distichum TaxID=126358 RepID=A0ABD1QFC9_9LAMI